MNEDICSSLLEEPRIDKGIRTGSAGQMISRL